MAITVEYAKCAACGRENAKSLEQCRGCGVALSSGTRAGLGSSGVGSALGNVAWKAITVQLVGGVVFLAGVFFWFGNVLGFFPTFPGLGYIVGLIGSAIWGAGSQMDD